MCSTNVAYTVGYDGPLPYLNGIVLKTTNSGSNWFSQYSSGIAIYTGFSSLCFVNESTGWLVGPVNAIYKTTNGGNNYFPQPYEADWHDVFFHNVDTGWVIGAFGMNGIAIKTTNSGSNWQTKIIYSFKYFTGIDFINQNTGFISARNGIILKTINAGNNWTEYDEGSSLSFYSVNFSSDNIGYVAGLQGRVYKTTNLGNNWNIVATNLGHYVNSIFMTSDQIGYMAGGFEFTSGIIKITTDGGFNWQEQYQSNLELKSVSFLTKTQDFVVV